MDALSCGKLRLGKGVTFVKSRLLRLPQADDIWQADFKPVPGPRPSQIEFWLGMVVENEFDAVLATMSVDHLPTVNDFATLVAQAMFRPLNDDRRHRPQAIRLRRDPAWEELLPHLRQLKIELLLADELPAWSEAAGEFGLSWAMYLRRLAGK